MKNVQSEYLIPVRAHNIVLSIDVMSPIQKPRPRTTTFCTFNSPIYSTPLECTFRTMVLYTNHDMLSMLAR